MSPNAALFLLGLFLFSRSAPKAKKVNQTAKDKPESPGPSSGYKLGSPAIPVLSSPKVGDFVKLRFIQGAQSERMWVKVDAVGTVSGTFSGLLDDKPVLLVSLSQGQRVFFKQGDIYQVLQA